MSRTLFVGFALLPLLTGCESVTDEEFTALQQEVSGLKDSLTEQADTIAAQDAVIASLQEEVSAITSSVDLTDLATTVEQHTTELSTLNASVTGILADYLIGSDLDDYATTSWVEAQSYASSETVAAHTTSIADNATAIATNTSDIADNASAIATHTTSIATNASAIASNDTDIATNASAISTNETDIGSN